MNRRVWLARVAVAAVVVAAGCGGNSPSSPSAGGNGVVVQGVMLGDGAAVVASSGSHPSSAKTQKVTVKVEGTTLTADVSANGTFELKGIPSGTFTLIFMSDGVEIGRIVVTAEDGSEVKIVVQVKDSILVVIEIKVESPEPVGSPSPATCIISGGKVGQGIELEGDVSSGTSAAFKMAVNGERASDLVTVNASSAAFKCIGGAKAETDAECKLAVTSGAKVHVRGTLMSCTTADAQVTATEVKVQKD
jgi:hypothetical protein